ncbi:MAG: LacI family DNA-binding transcriptional regulator [Ardenticatenaceae bacterium]|nr:LacI family DNA-binding transcriptional regulator [Ardenticatenaceae bacterium]
MNARKWMEPYKPMDERLTLEKIGELAGVSRATVSRVVNSQPNVRPEVRERVLAVIAETGYQPHLAARSLASNRTGLIGLVIPRILQSLFTDPYYPRLLQGVTQVCNEHAVILTLFMFHSEDEETRLYPRVLRPGTLDGVVVVSSQEEDPLIARLAESGLPFIVIGRPTDATAVSYVDVDNVTGAETAVSHLINLGRQRIATITGRQDMSAGLDRLEGYRRALLASGRAIDEALIAAGEFEEGQAYEAMLRLLPQQPDAVFVASDAMALGALNALHSAGLEVPGDVAVVGYDDLPAAAIASPPLTTVRQPIRRFGALAVETLLNIIETGSEPPRHILLPTELIIRETCGGS